MKGRVAWLLAGCWLSVVGGARAERPLTFEHDIRPILQTHCFYCHGEADERESNLDLRLRRWLVTGGDSGPAIVPGSPGKSRLLERIRSGEMPPGDDKRLSGEEASRIEAWISAGAPTAEAEPESLGDGPHFTAADRNYWAFRPVTRPPVPPPVDPSRHRSANPIDRFLSAQLAEAGNASTAGEPWHLAPEADRETLVRRAFLDLLGLPPTPEQIDEFLGDSRPGAWERLIDRLLASPRYGERWGRHWLDVAGYADSDGYVEDDPVRQHAYHYRDYVIDAWNRGLPYDQFVTEQLAGDELAGWSLPTGGSSTPPAPMDAETTRLLAATGFLRTAPDGSGAAGVDQDVARNQVVADTLQIVGASLLGMTVHCAQCHDHRYDPIPQSDYYRMRAVFEPAMNWKSWPPASARLVSLYTAGQRQLRESIEAEAKQADAARQERVDFYIDKTLEHELLLLDEPLRGPLRSAYKTPAAKRTPEQKKLLEAHANIANISAGSLYLYDRRREARAKALEALGYREAAEEIRSYRIRDELQKLADAAAAIRERIPEERFLRIFSEPATEPPPTFVFHRGDHQQPRAAVAPGELSVLGRPSLPIAGDLPTSGRRLALARSLLEGRHPLVTRAIANRLWMHHFGRGLAPTPGDFGRLGERPTHPALLDYLASEIVDGQWDIKRLQRLIVTSAAYRQSAIGQPSLMDSDAENRLLGRWPLRRLEAESVRDSMLAIAGQLNTVMHGAPVPVMEDAVGQIIIGQENLDGERKPGKPVDLGGEPYRRSVYVQVRRSRPLGSLEAFDIAETAPHCTQRPASNVTPQALMLMNSRFVLDNSRQFARRVSGAAGNDTDRLRLAWRLTFGREPTEQQLRESEAFLHRQLEVFAAREGVEQDAQRELAMATYCQALFSSNRFLYIQ